MKINSCTIEYFDLKENKWKIGDVFDIFTITAVRETSQPDIVKYGRGLNVCLVFSNSSVHMSAGKETHDALLENFIRGTTPFTVYFLGEQGIKIPIKIAEGNGWTNEVDIDYGYGDFKGKKISTACFFGYVDPFIWKSEK